LPLLRGYYASVQLHKADDALARREFARRIEAQFAREQELAVAPAFFQSLVRHLPRLSRVEIRPKRGRIPQ
jgi:hypothetical protein